MWHNQKGFLQHDDLNDSIDILLDKEKLLCLKHILAYVSRTSLEEDTNTPTYMCVCIYNHMLYVISNPVVNWSCCDPLIQDKDKQTFLSKN